MALLFSALVCVVMALVLWLTSKVLKFKKQGLMAALLPALVYIAISYVLSLIIVVRTSYVALTALVWLLSIKLSYKEGWLKTFVASAIAWIGAAILMMIIGLIFWQAGVFSI